MKAGKNHIPNAMRVSQRINPLDDNSQEIYSEIVNDGVCGFAWVNIKPGNCRFANWLKKNDLGRIDSYYGGVTIWVDEFNQSLERKEAYARAFADVILESGIEKCYIGSKMD